MKSRKPKGKARVYSDPVPQCPKCSRRRALPYQRDFGGNVIKWRCRDDGTIYAAPKMTERS